MPLNASLHIETKCRNHKTILKTSFCTQPFRIADITENKSDKSLRLMLMCSSPGILEGDRYTMAIDLEEGCSLTLETQSYQRLFQMKTGASQEFTVRMKKGSSFTYLPHPVVPHKNAVFRSRNQIFLEDGCSLCWGEVISCGRKLNGEIFQFTSYHGLTEIYRNEKLAVKENLLLQPAQINPAAIGQLEGYSHQATLLFINDTAEMQELIANMVAMLTQEKRIIFGASLLDVKGLVVRLLGFGAEQLFLLLKTLATMAQHAGSLSSKTKEAYVV